MNERRKFKRIQRDPLACNINIDMSFHPGAIIEESIGGLKIRGLDLLVLPQDYPITIEHLGVQQTGIVRSITRNSGTFEVGISLQPLDFEETSEKNLLLSCFIYEAEQLVVCQPLELDQNGQVRITLWNDAERVVDRSQLVPLTRGERKQVLDATPEHVNFLQAQYSLGQQEDLVDAILEYEFVIPQSVESDAS